MPFVLGWMLWSRHNILHTADQTLIYYTDYARMEFLTVGLDNFAQELVSKMEAEFLEDE